MSTDTTPAFSVTRDTRVKLPLALLWGIVATSALVGGYVYTLRGEVAAHTREIRQLQDEFRSTRELLARVEERMKNVDEAVRRIEGRLDGRSR